MTEHATTSSLRFHEISEANHRILNPLSEDKFRLLGEICGLREGMSQLDLACGKGEMLCQWALHYGITGVGVDISHTFLEAARERARELGIASKVDFIEHEASTFQAAPHSFDVVSCIGATWIGNGLAGTLRLMNGTLKPGGLLLIGEPYWIEVPSAGSDMLAADPSQFATLVGTLDRFHAEGAELIEMVLADRDD